MKNIIRVFVLAMTIAICSGCAATKPFGAHPDYVQEMETLANQNVNIHPDEHLRLTSNDFRFWLLTADSTNHACWEHFPWHGGHIDYNSQIHPYDKAKRTVLYVFHQLSNEVGRDNATSLLTDFHRCIDKNGILINPNLAPYISMALAIAHNEQWPIEDLFENLKRGL